MAKKKVVEKVAPKNLEESLIEEADGLSAEEAQEIVDAGVGFEKPKAVEEVDEDTVKVRIPVRIKIARQILEPGVHVVPKHQLASIREIVSKKLKTDLSIFTGKNYIIERLIDRTLVIKETSEIDLKKIGS